MPKNGNLMKFWESLEASQQSSAQKPPIRPHTQVKVGPTMSNLKLRSVSQGNLLGLRQTTTPGKELLENFREEKTEGMDEEVSRRNARHDERKDDSGRSSTEGDGPLPLIQRHEVLINATKGRARRTKKQPSRLKKHTSMEVKDLIHF